MSTTSSSSSINYIPEVPIPTSITNPIGNPDRVAFSEKNLLDIRTVAARGLAISSTTTSQYIASLPTKVLLSKTAYACDYAVRGMVAGGVAGGVGGTFIAGVGTVPGILIGGGAGYMGGLIYGSIKVHRETRKEFDAWKKDQTKATIDEFRQMFKDHPTLEMCIDPITLDPIVLPAHCNCPEVQHTLEYDTLSESIKINGVCPADLLRRAVPKNSEIRIDYRSLGVFHLVYAQLMELGASRANLSPNLMKGIQHLVDDLQRHKTFLYERENTDIQNKISEINKRKTENVPQMLAKNNEIVILANRLSIITRLMHPSLPSSSSSTSSTSSTTSK